MRELTTQLRKQYGQGFVSRHFPEDDPALNVKRSMKERFGLRKVRADSSGLVKAPLLPPVHLLQLDEHFRNAWIDYSALDAKVSESGVGWGGGGGEGTGRCGSRLVRMKGCMAHCVHVAGCSPE
jgi:hypothetical protein